ncbi:MAG: Gfo/Idh/MocA family oxidoreductase, partial [Lachnospiraceae bacterium]|nr:Gfo/Idh/MocA family oxidoreductase [Lachnospiraceae bacterium]
MDTKKVTWGILGTANIARWATIPGMKKAGNCELYAIAGRSIAKAQSFAAQYGIEKAYGSYDELLADDAVQAVYIPLPNDLHLPWVTKALQAGKHVLCEKPLAINASEARAMYQTARENGVILMEAYAYLHSPYVESLKQGLSLCHNMPDP